MNRRTFLKALAAAPVVGLLRSDKAAADPQSIGNPRDVDAAAYRKIYAQAFGMGREVGQ